MCTRPVPIYYNPQVANPYERGLSSKVFRMVPCGKCEECLNKRKNSMAARIYETAKNYGECWFLTLTYNNKSLPLSVVDMSVDQETGEVFRSGVPEILSLKENNERRKELLPGVLRLRSSRMPRYAFHNGDGSVLRLVTPSVSRLDFRLWLKNARVRYEREFHCSLSEFKYLAIFEYGGRRCRPHVHLFLAGLSRQECLYLSEDWSKKEDRGFSYLEKCFAVNKDGTDGFELLGKYLGKYVSKGSFECESVKKGYSEKPRFCNSRGFGDTFSVERKNYYHAFDLVGEYDPMTLRWIKSNGSRPKMSQNDIDEVCSLIELRQSFTFGNTTISMPQYYVKKIFCFYKKATQSYGKQTILYAYQDFKNRRIVESNLREQEDYRSRFAGREDVNFLVEWQKDRDAALAFRASLAQESQFKRFRKSPSDAQ